MKKVIYSLLLFCGLVGLWGCEKTTEGLTKVTYYVNFEMNGDDPMLVSVGSSFADPGVVAKEGEEDVTASVIVNSNVDASKIGLYSVSYSAANADGFSSSAKRTVIVYDPAITTNASGSYTVDASVSYRDMNGAQAPFKGDFSISVDQVAAGIFAISDFLGGWYDQGAAYGASYAMKGYFKLNADNTIEPLSSLVAGWGDSMDSMREGKYDPETGQISWYIDYAGQMTFYVVMNK